MIKVLPLKEDLKKDKCKPYYIDEDYSIKNYIKV